MGTAAVVSLVVAVLVVVVVVVVREKVVLVVVVWRMHKNVRTLPLQETPQTFLSPNPPHKEHPGRRSSLHKWHTPYSLPVPSCPT